MKNILQTKSGQAAVIKDIGGGEGVKRRLLSLGFNPGDRIELAGRTILRGPVLIKNVQTGAIVAVGRSIAQKIFVEPVDELS